MIEETEGQAPNPESREGAAAAGGYNAPGGAPAASGAPTPMPPAAGQHPGTADEQPSNSTLEELNTESGGEDITTNDGGEDTATSGGEAAGEDDTPAADADDAA